MTEEIRCECCSSHLFQEVRSKPCGIRRGRRLVARCATCKHPAWWPVGAIEVRPTGYGIYSLRWAA